MSDLLHRQIAQLREQLEERDETIRQLQAQLVEDAPLPSWVPHLTRQEEQMFRLLWKREFVPHETLEKVLPEDVEYPRNHVAVRMSWLRKKLSPAGLTIKNVHSRGYRLDGVALAQLRSAA